LRWRREAPEAPQRRFYGKTHNDGDRVTLTLEMKEMVTVRRASYSKRQPERRELGESWGDSLNYS
jgi:hypothetical protein